MKQFLFFVAIATTLLWSCKGVSTVTDGVKALKKVGDTEYGAEKPA